MSNYTLQKINDVTIVFAPDGLGIQDFVCIANSSGQDAFLDLGLAKYLDAHTVCGPQSALTAMRANPPEPGPATENEVKQAKRSGLSESAVSWLLGFDRGLSSETLFSMATGLNLRNGHQTEVPHDSGDFKRCALLANTCTEVKLLLSSPTRLEQLNRYAAGNANFVATWAELFNHWEVLTQMDEASLHTFFESHK